jgi:molecular chaperone HscB
MPEESCWSCGGHDADSVFCRFCNSLQAPATDYYQFFGLPKKLSLDVDELQKKFYTLSRLVHPDHYTRAASKERQYSLEATSILNDGYRTLRDPILRAEYILKENGFEIGEQRSKNVPPELLEEVFELNMQLDELRAGDDQVRDDLNQSRDRFVDMLAGIDAGLDVHFQAYDSAASADAAQQSLGEIRGILNRRRYILNLIREVDKELTARNA